MTGPIIAAIDGGTSFHHDGLRRPPAAFDRRVPLHTLTAAAIRGVDILVVPCRTNGQWLADRRAVFTDFLAGGGHLVVMGETRPDLWLDGIGFESRPTNFWWWLEPGASLGIQVVARDHPLLSGMGEDDLTWHEHGVLTGPPGLTTLVVNAEGLPIMIEGAYGGGRLCVTTLDPFYHHGSWFMPATTRFLGAFLGNLAPWYAASPPPGSHFIERTSDT